MLFSMSNTDTVSIACASAFWGDTPYAVRQLLSESRLDFIALDYLSEVTMALLVRGLRKDPNSGYTPDFLTDVIEPHLAEIANRGIKIITNAGGMNPVALAQKIRDFAKTNNIGVTVAAVDGDDLRHLKLGEYASANAYLGASGIVAALDQGAQIVITGRVVDSALVTGPIAQHFGWSFDKNFDLLAQASLAGHVIECGTQCTGGNFTDWTLVPMPENMGFPIVRFEKSGAFTVTKPAGTGGLVTVATVAEQIVYEIGDPGAYILPDVICDFTEVKLTQLGQDLVRVEGARGIRPTSQYKVSATVQKGFKISTTAFIGGGDSEAKARAIGMAILKRCGNLISKPYTQVRQEVIAGRDGALLRLSAAHEDPAALDVLAKEIAPAGTSLAPGVANLLGGRAHAVPRIAFESFLIDKSKVEVRVTGENGTSKVSVNSGSSETVPVSMELQPRPAVVGDLVPLHKLAYARSGDKGNHVNIGVVARKPEYLPIIKAALSAESVAMFFAGDFDDARRQTVKAWPLPGFHALNFLIFNCLDGGGSFSLKIDPQGKAFGQRLLQMSVPVPKGLL